MKILNIAILIFASLHVHSQTTLILQPGPQEGKDSEIFSCIPCGYADNTYGNIQDLNALAWTNNGNESLIRSLIEFDLSSIPAGTLVNQAILSLYHNPDSPEIGHSSLTNSNESIIRRVTSEWDENLVTWNTKPTTTVVNEVFLFESTTSDQDYANVNVTDLIQDIVDNATSSFGFEIKQIDESYYCSLIFASSDHHNPELHPKLELTYTLLTEVSEEGSKPDLKVYPNPASDELFVVGTNGSSTLYVADFFGKVVLSKSFLTETYIDVSTLSTGVYMLTIQDELSVRTAKVLISNKN